jgi:hypothetical protein
MFMLFFKTNISFLVRRLFFGAFCILRGRSRYISSRNRRRIYLSQTLAVRRLAARGAWRVRRRSFSSALAACDLSSWRGILKHLQRCRSGVAHALADVQISAINNA